MAITPKNKIDIIVENWDLSDEQRKHKREILEEWRNLVKDEYEFNDLLAICQNFNYYSEKLTADAYKVIYENFKTSKENFGEFINKSMFMPLRRKERMESSVDMFSNFRLVNNLEANRTYVDGPTSFLTYYENSARDLKEKVKRNDSQDEEKRKTIKGLEESLKLYTQDPKINSKITKRIDAIKNDLDKKNEDISKEIDIFNHKYFHIKNIVIIDDFIGTGTSVVKLIKKIHGSLKRLDIKIYLWVVETSIAGKEEIEEIAKVRGINIEIMYFKISINVLENNTIFSSQYIKTVKSMVKKINQQFGLKDSLFCKNHAIASFVNAPNNNLTLLSDESRKWKAIFFRTKRKERKSEKVNNNELKDILKFLRG